MVPHTVHEQVSALHGVPHHRPVLVRRPARVVLGGADAAQDVVARPARARLRGRAQVLSRLAAQALSQRGPLRPLRASVVADARQAERQEAAQVRAQVAADQGGRGAQGGAGDSLGARVQASHGAHATPRAGERRAGERAHRLASRAHASTRRAARGLRPCQDRAHQVQGRLPSAPRRVARHQQEAEQRARAAQAALAPPVGQVRGRPGARPGHHRRVQADMQHAEQPDSRAEGGGGGGCGQEQEDDQKEEEAAAAAGDAGGAGEREERLRERLVDVRGQRVDQRVAYGRQRCSCGQPHAQLVVSAARGGREPLQRRGRRRRR